MTSLSGTHVKAANPEPFQPYAAYLAWVEGDKCIMEYATEYEDGMSGNTPTIAENIQDLSLAMENRVADPARILGYLLGYVTAASENSRILDEESIERKTALAALEYLQNNPSPQACCYFADLYERGSFELGIAEDAQKAQEWLLKAAEGGDLRAQYQLGASKLEVSMFETKSDDAIADGLKLLWTAAQGLYPLALMRWGALLSDDTTRPGSLLNVPRGQIDEMAESCGLLSRLMACAPNGQQKLLRGVLIGQVVAWEGNGMSFYPDSVLAALRRWEKEQEQEQESPHAIENLVQSLYGLACLDRGAPISPTATPNNEPVVAPK